MADDPKAADETTAQLFAALGAVAQAVENGAPSSGSITCPICETGRLRYRLEKPKTRGGRGYAAGACTTEGCVRWMS